MAAIPKRTIERLNKSVGKFQKILGIAKDRDVNEADTVSIIVDMLAEVFGFDKYLEVTSEFAIRNTYCDLAIKINDKIQYVIEAKAIGLSLNEHHLRQVVEYGANHGVQWVVLTNGINWEIHRIRFEKPINYDLICSFNFLEINPKKTEDQDRLFLLCKKGISSEAREDYYEHVQCVNRFMISAIILGDAVESTIRRELKKLSAGLKIENPEIEKILRSEVLKRDVLEGDEATKAKGRIKRLQSKSKKKPIVSKTPKTEPRAEEEAMSSVVNQDSKKTE